MSMGESTRRRLEGAVRSAAGGAAQAQYVGGWQGGLGGTWGKAARGLEQKAGDLPGPSPVRWGLRTRHAMSCPCKKASQNAKFSC